MPRVEQNAECTLVILTYRSLRWLDWCLAGIEAAQTRARYRLFIVANDATTEVSTDPRICLQFANADPTEFYINRVYRAWNAGVLEAPTQWVVMLNSDMWPHDGWLDALLRVKRDNPMTVPTSLLVESGRLPSGMPEHVRNHGMNPDEFDAAAFREHADTLVRERAIEAGRLYMPILVDRQEFFDVGGYPEGNPEGTTGDKDLIARYAAAGYKHVTSLGSIVYHCQVGEQSWP